MIFSHLYVKTMAWARDPRSVHYLAIMSACESIFWPIPVDIMLAPMGLAKPERAFYFAMIATLSSVFGALIGYGIGYFLFESVAFPVIEAFGYQHAWETAKDWFTQWGIWIVFVAGFSPIPYKVFTLTAGSMHMASVPFILISLLSRGLRFFLVSGFVRFGGERLEQSLHKYIEYLGWLCVVCVVGVYWSLSS